MAKQELVVRNAKIREKREVIQARLQIEKKGWIGGLEWWDDEDVW